MTGTAATSGPASSEWSDSSTARDRGGLEADEEVVGVVLVGKWWRLLRHLAGTFAIYLYTAQVEMYLEP
jgi:hypothetical protein